MNRAKEMQPSPAISQRIISLKSFIGLQFSAYSDKWTQRLDLKIYG